MTVYNHTAFVNTLTEKQHEAYIDFLLCNPDQDNVQLSKVFKNTVIKYL